MYRAVGCGTEGCGEGLDGLGGRFQPNESVIPHSVQNPKLDFNVDAP